MGRPLLLLHGALGSKDQFVKLQAMLSASRKVYTLDFEGHGGAKPIRDFSIDHFGENVRSFCDRENLETVDIFGFSMGGYVGLYLALHHPSRVGKIITLGTKFDWNSNFASQEIQKLNPYKIKEKVPAFAKGLSILHGDENWENVVLKTAKMMEELGSNPSLTKNDFRRIQNPTLICLGELDSMSTVEESKDVADWLQNGSFKLIENLKHPIESAPVEKLVQLIESYF